MLRPDDPQGKDDHIGPGTSASAKLPLLGGRKTPNHIRFTELPAYESDVPEDLPKDVAQDDYEMGDDIEDSQEEDARAGDDDDDVEYRQEAVRPRIYTPQTNPKFLFYRAMDDDAEPPRPDDDFIKLLPADADLSDVRLDVLELWHVDSDGCTLTDVEDVVLWATAEDIAVHANLRRDVLCDIIRRFLCLRRLDDVDWLRHVPEEYFDQAYTRVEGELGGWDRPWPPVCTDPHETSEPSNGDDDASDMEDEVPSTSKTCRSKKRASGSSASTTSPRSKRSRRSGSQGRGTSDSARRVARFPELSSDFASDELGSPVRRRSLSLPQNAAPDFCHTETAETISRFVNGVQVHLASQSGKHQTRELWAYKAVPTSSAEAKGRLDIAEYLTLVDSSGPSEDAPWNTMSSNREEVYWFAYKEVTEGCPSGISDEFMALVSEYVLLMLVHRRAQRGRGHWVVFDRSSKAQKQVYLDCASRQRLWYKALTKLRVKAALLPAQEREWLCCEPGLWRRSRLGSADTWCPHSIYT
ncbi:LOW QUALITY PROTEIN: hypothetical protein PHMEG_00013677 [Phytophthora megakarya]|uniref:Uncharacterized protein n=1 Tax=Phytophthora megakarya TaxID=4795 RepID=A0A225W5S1_9STRA|nr:LOW QUALITY PROTEIN: hypothetical protein PHMEG_00013677 [Phytophthora megakarya]